MDNLTHTLVGLIAGEAVVRTAPERSGGLPPSTRRRVLLAVGMAGSNLPDLDLAWSMQFATGDQLSYLLHHRGHTHTIVGCFALAVLLAAVVWAWMRWRKLRPDRDDWKLIGAVALLSVGLHLGMDALNSYGVHPYWPFDNRWYYGDSVFIIEPLYWLAAAPLLWALRTTPGRLLLGATLVLASAVLWLAHSAWLPIWLSPLPAIALALVGWKRRPATAALVSVAMLVAVTAMYGVAGHVAGRQAMRIAAESFPGARTLDAVLSPAPSHPVCWDLLLVQVQQEELVVRQGRMSLWSSVDADICPSTQLGSGRTAPLRRVPAAGNAHVRWVGEFAMPTAQLVWLVEFDCRAREMMQFLRVPFAVRQERRWILGDLRFDRENGAGFAEEFLPLEGGSACRYDVPWEPPRADLLPASP